MNTSWDLACDEDIMGHRSKRAKIVPLPVRACVGLEGMTACVVT